MTDIKKVPGKPPYGELSLNTTTTENTLYHLPHIRMGGHQEKRVRGDCAGNTLNTWIPKPQMSFMSHTHIMYKQWAYLI